jgi:mono/diheme cytochrome c family protein
MKQALLIVGLVFVAVAAGSSREESLQAQAASSPQVRLKPDTTYKADDQAFVDKYCVGCHNARTLSGNLSLAGLDASKPADHPETFEKVIRKVRAGLMPPAGMPRPERTTLDGFAAGLETKLDRAAALKPNPGSHLLHRMNRAEYANAIRDLLHLDVDETTLLPADDSSEGFDNIADALRVSPALVERYTSAAVKVSRLAVGNLLLTASTATYRVPGDLAQSNHLDGLPLGTRGGTLFEHNFPLEAEYSFKIRVRGAAIGLAAANLQGEEIEISLDGERIKLVPATATIDLKLPIRAGPHSMGVTFVRKPPPGADEVWQVFASNSGVQSVAITGPLAPSGLGDTPSRQRIFVCRPSSTAEESPCAKRILATVARRAFRRPVTDADVEALMGFYETGRQTGTFDAGVEQGLARVLVDPRFVFRLEREPSDAVDGKPYRVSDLDLASRLSFFLWSSIPDDALLDAAIAGTLHEPAVLERHTRRMLADPKAHALVTNFGGQWLYLRELKNARPETAGFTDNLRQSLRRETEMLLESIVREDRSVIDLLDADYTFVDETLAKHYGIPNVRGSRFRRVAVTDEARRGLLGHGSFLLVTSVANRTSPVSRGKWILENLLGVPPPLPPPNVPAIDESPEAAKASSLRQKMEIHRGNPTCAACHRIMDPIGFTLENFDLVGRWRTRDGNSPIDATSQLFDGTPLDGPVSLRKALLARSDVFARTATEKLMIYGTGRALKYYDMPVVRQIARDAAKNDYRFSSLVLGIVKSDPFQMKMKTSGE